MAARARVVRRGVGLALALTCACTGSRRPEAGDWFDAGDPLDVAEPIAYTTEPYGLPASGLGFGDLPMPPEYTTWFAPDDLPPDGCSDWSEEPGQPVLPATITGVVTIHPRYYVKVNGCVPASDNSVDSDEKYYGSYFIEDDSGGIFVLGDSKVAAFDMGDRVTLLVRGIRNNFDLPMVALHDVLAVDRGPYPIHYDVADAALGGPDVGRVRRVTGVVADEPDTFGEFHLTGPDGVVWTVALDQELNRRGVQFAVGSEIEVTGPVNFSYDTFTLIVMRIGQVVVLND